MATLLEAGLRPYQLSLDRSEKPVFIKSPEQDLTFGIGTVFVEDPVKCAASPQHVLARVLWNTFPATI